MIDEAILQGISEVARLHLGWEGGDLSPEMRLVEDLRLDSVRLLTLAAEVENRFRIFLGLSELEPVDVRERCDATSVVAHVEQPGVIDDRQLHGAAAAVWEVDTCRFPVPHL